MIERAARQWQRAILFAAVAAACGDPAVRPSDLCHTLRAYAAHDRGTSAAFTYGGLTSAHCLSAPDLAPVPARRESERADESAREVALIDEPRVEGNVDQGRVAGRKALRRLIEP